MMKGLDRREFLKVSVTAAGGMTVAIGGFDRALGAAAPAGAPGAAFAPSAWLRIPADGPITFVLDRAEMGQGVYTSLPMLVAEELGVDPAALKIEFAPADRAYANPKFGLQATGGSTSVAAAWEPLREAGAVARQMLVAAAAKRWGVDPKSCRAEDGFVVAGEKRLAFGALAADAAKERVPEPELKARSEFKIIGKPRARLDGALKATGRAGFGIDVDVPDMRVAVVKRCPTLGGRVGKFDAATIQAMPGVEKVVAVPSGVAIIAKKYWQAKKAAEALAVEWDLTAAKRVSTEILSRDWLALAQTERQALAKKLDEPHAGARVVEADYEIPYLAHAAMEPGVCVAHVTKDGVDIWAPTQAAGLAQQLAAALTGLPHEKVRVHSTFLGGGFGRRLYQDFVVEAVHVAQQVPYPVKVQWTREDDMRHDFYRPMTAHALKGIVTESGQVAFAHAIAGQSLLEGTIPEWLPAMLPPWMPEGMKRAFGSAASVMMGLGTDSTSVEGSADSPYGFTQSEVSHVKTAPGIPVGFWRSVGHSYTGFVVESFIDELAHAVNFDPVAFRRGLLKDAPRPLKVLQLAAEKAGWERPLPPNTFRGVAQHSSFGSHCAQVAEVYVDPATKAFSVKRVVCAVDCGIVVDPDGVEAQMQSGIVFGLSAALFGAITYKDGAVEQSNFHDFPVARMTDAPTIEVHIVESNANPSGVGEPGVPPVAAAVGNALFAATKTRLRRLPLTLT